MGMMARHDAAAWRGQLEQLLPRGAAWTCQPGGAMDGLLRTLAEALARAEARIAVLLAEADPRTALELLADWERTTGLPDACFGQPDNIPERQIAVTQRITGAGGQSRAWFTELAASIGYAVAIEEFRPCRMGSRIGDRLYGAGWRHVWRMVVLSADAASEGQMYRTQARIGDRLGVRLRGFGAIDLECLIRRHAPAHSRLFFAYPAAPEPALWFDFTQP